MTAALGGAALAIFVALAAWLAPLEPGVVALQFAATPTTFAAIVHGWGPEGLARYRAHFPADFGLLACYGAFGWRLARRMAAFAPLPPWAAAAAAWTLPAAALADAAENLLHLWLTAAPRLGVAWPYAAAALAAAVKWLLLIAFTAMLSWAALRPRSAPH